MTRRQIAYNTMAHKTIGELNLFQDIWKDNKVMLGTVGAINQLFKEIEITANRQTRTTKGLSEFKQQYRTELDDTSDIFLGIFRSYANTTGDKDLYAKSNISASDIQRLKSLEIMRLVNQTLAYAVANATELEPYGMTEKKIADYQASATNYLKYETLPQEIAAQKKTATLELKQWFKQLDQTLNQSLDNHMMQYKSSQPQFYQDYENARIIYDDITIPLSLAGTVSNHELSHTLQYVQVSVKFKPGAALKENVKITTAKGNYQYKGLPEGKCTVTFQLDGYDTLVVDSHIRAGTLIRLDVQLQKTKVVG